MTVGFILFVLLLKFGCYFPFRWTKSYKGRGTIYRSICLKNYSNFSSVMSRADLSYSAAIKNVTIINATNTKTALFLYFDILMGSSTMK